MSVNNTNPGTIFGGTWEQLKDRFLLGAGDTYKNGTTGGEKTHKLTVEEMPEHYHAGIKYSYYNQWLTSETGSNSNTVGLKFNSGGNSYSNVQNNENLQYSTDKRGGSQPHNNMPPYLTVYMWKRTA